MIETGHIENENIEMEKQRGEPNHVATSCDQLKKNNRSIKHRKIIFVTKKTKEDDFVNWSNHEMREISFNIPQGNRRGPRS